MPTRSTLLLVFVCFAISNSFGQYELVYDSLYQPLPGYAGHAKFSYVIGSKGERIKEGPFLFKSKKIDSTGGMNVQRLVWEGEFEHDLKVGDWSYETVSNDLKLKDIDDEFNVQYELHSIKEQLKAQFEEGKPDGKWRLEREVLKDSKPVRMIRSVRGNMDRSKFYGNVEIYGMDDQNKPYSLEGETDEGLLVEEWIFEYFEEEREIRETRYYDRGFLLQLTKQDVSTGENLVDLNFPLSQQIQLYLMEEGSEKAADRPLSLTYSDGYPRNSIFIVEQKKGNVLIEKAINDLFKFEEDYFASNGLPLGTNRLYYPLSNEEKETVKKWSEVEFKLRDKVTAIEELRDANFQYTDNDTLNLINEWVDRQSYLLSYIKPWNQIIAHDELTFYHREGQLFEYAYELLHSDTIISGEITSLLAYDKSGETDSSFLFYVVKNFEERTLVGDSLLAKYAGIVKQLNLQKEILLQEKQINQLKTFLDSIYSISIPEEKLMMDLQSAIKAGFLTTSFDKRYKGFIAFEGSREEHKAKGDSLVYDLRLLKDSYFTMEDIFYTAKTIDTLYTEYVFDPYTFNDRFPKRMKKKLYQAAAVELFEDLLELAKGQPTPVQLRATLNRAQGLQERLIFLVDKDTGKLERKLRDKLTMEKTLELLKID